MRPSRRRCCESRLHCWLWRMRPRSECSLHQYSLSFSQIGAYIDHTSRSIAGRSTSRPDKTPSWNFGWPSSRCTLCPWRTHRQSLIHKIWLSLLALRMDPLLNRWWCSGKCSSRCHLGRRSSWNLLAWSDFSPRLFAFGKDPCTRQHHSKCSLKMFHWTCWTVPWLSHVEHSRLCQRLLCFQIVAAKSLSYLRTHNRARMLSILGFGTPQWDRSKNIWPIK